MVVIRPLRRWSRESSSCGFYTSCGQLENMPLYWISLSLTPLCPYFFFLGLHTLIKQILKHLPQALLSEEPRVDSPS